ncbi:hypothetical protein DL766_009628 [Monosporascus sp. MC13-8B]|nr:hypothetical protein DL763_010587 [Monosporascus cannonballus]RYP14584.1 hypothetical protein DL766_009628 [Monosporascus sp. MC13-8B]
MASMLRKANAAFRGGSDAQQGARQDDGGESLTTILGTADDRAALNLLLCDITEQMRRQLMDAFDPKSTDDEAGPAGSSTPGEENDDAAEGDKLDDDGRKKQLEKLAEKQKAELAKREKEVTEEKMVALKNAALNFLDDWRDSVILRVGEVVNSYKTAEDQAQQSRPSTAQTRDGSNPVDGETSQHDREIDEAMRKQYPPLDTALREFHKEKRILILHSTLLLMLSLEHYKAHSRTLLLHLAASLDLAVRLLSEDESKVARGLLEAAENMSADEETKKKVQQNSTARRWKVGLAGVAGAALIGITGGLAAPLLAAGVGTVMGGIGLGATATAGYLGTLAGSSVLVGGLFGAYGGRMTGKVMDQYAREVEDFRFVPVKSAQKRLGGPNNEARRLRVAIGVSGWLSDEDDVVDPWRIVGNGQETFALRFELEALIELGNALTTMVTSAALSVARSEIIKRTVFAALAAGLWPLALVKASCVIDNPWSVANHRAQKAGEVLADALINKAQGERPVTLVGYSLGAKVIYVCLKQLAQRQAFGLVENAILLGAPTPSSSADWRRVRSVVSGRVVNAYSTKDYILGFLYRSSSVQLGVAGLQPVLHVKGVENVDVSDLVEGHTMYRNAMGPILRRIGFEDIDPRELERAERELQRQGREGKEQREAAEKKASSEPEGTAAGPTDAEQKDLGEEEVRKMEQEVEQKNKTSTMDRMTARMRIAGNPPKGAYKKMRTR